MTKQKHFYLIRGLIREARHWGELPQLIKNSSPSHRVTSIDIPGAGIYFNSPSPLSIPDMVERMRRVYLTIPKEEGEEAVLVAISLGGMIAAQWMKDHPGDFQKAILINTSYGGLSPMYQRLKLDAFCFLLKVPLLKGRAKEAHILKLVSNHPEVFETTLECWHQIQQDQPVALTNTFRQLIAAARFRIGNFKPHIPVLLLASVKDRMVSIKCSRSIAQAWKAPLIEHPTAGHDLSADDPHWVLEKIKDF